MTKLFYEGGAGFMGVLTLIFLVILILVVVNTIVIFKSNASDSLKNKERLSLIKSVGLFALVVGILGQLIGLYSAFLAIQSVHEVSPALLAGGLRVSMIPTLYGIVIFLISHLFWFGLVALSINKTKDN